LHIAGCLFTKPQIKTVTVPTDIIVVDDNKDISALLKSVLEFAGHSVVVCPGKEELMEALSLAHPQLIVMDMMLGNDDGRDICRVLKTSPQTSHIAILMISAHPDASESCHTAGANSFLEKPFEMDALLEHAKTLLSRTASC
jgi:DNA-binding response OmpR family regulator